MRKTPAKRARQRRLDVLQAEHDHRVNRDRAETARAKLALAVALISETRSILKEFLPVEHEAHNQVGLAYDRAAVAESWARLVRDAVR